jgi:hypothetical protein
MLYTIHSERMLLIAPESRMTLLAELTRFSAAC